jgi:hypothetical protein
MERKVRDFVRHYDAFGASPLVLPIAGNASSGAFGLLSAYNHWALFPLNYCHYDSQDHAVLMPARNFALLSDWLTARHSFSPFYHGSNYR